MSAALFSVGLGKFAIASFPGRAWNKFYFTIPLYLTSAFVGVRLWEKLTGHYLNFIDYDVSHDFKINYEQRYKLFDKDESSKNEEDFTLKQLKATSLNLLKQGKNDNEASMLSQIRNFENIVFCDPKEVAKCQNTLELQVLIDSAVPTVDSSDSTEKVRKFQEELYNWKLSIESKKMMTSEKERFLGLPFQLIRHRQYPEPAKGTWQWNLFQELFGRPYSYGKDEVESKEKINKYNYKNFLHPSIIEKYGDDPLNLDFEMYIKLKNIESKTRLEEAKELRKFFCQEILPELNILRDEQKGRDFANVYLNKIGNRSQLKQYMKKKFSNEEEEKLFREAEETRLLDKNPTVVNNVISTTIPDKFKGLRGKELRELLENPRKKSSVEKVLKSTYKHTIPKTKYELLLEERNRIGLIDTAIEENIDLNNAEEFNYNNLFNKTYDNPDPSEIEESSFDRKNRLDTELNSFPYGHPGSKYFSYDDRVSFEDYLPQPTIGHVSVGKNRYTHRIQDEEEKFTNEHSIKFGNQNSFVVPHLERSNDEAQEKVQKPNNHKMFEDRKNLYIGEMGLLEDFVNSKVERDSATDFTEEELNQALFEAQYTKSIDENSERRNLKKRTREEVLDLMKNLKMEPDALWDHKLAPYDRKSFLLLELSKRPIYENAQLNDPLYFLFSEVEQPEAMRKALKEWRKGAEIRVKLPYYPETKKPSKYFEMI